MVIQREREGHSGEQAILIVGTAPVLTTALQERWQHSTGYDLITMPPHGSRDHSCAPASGSAQGETSWNDGNLNNDGPLRKVRAVVYIIPAAATRKSVRRELRRVDDVLCRARSVGAPIYLVTGVSTESVAGSPGRGSTSSLSTAVEFLRRSGHPHVIVRTSTLIGASGTGVIAEFGAIYRLSKALLQARCPRIRFSAGARVDLVPCDIAADVLARLIENRFLDGEYWLTAGEHSLTVEEAVAELFSEARQAGVPVPDSPVVYGTSVSRVEAGDTARGRRASTLIFDSPLESSLGNEFETSLGELGSIGTRALPSAHESLRASLRYWATVSASPIANYPSFTTLETGRLAGSPDHASSSLCR